MSGTLQDAPTATLSPLQRLAEPTMPAQPAQADHGAKVYWLWCLPCHGDRGQGLTDEFRETYPPEDQYCWERGCHGERPYESGFELPMQVPAVVGSNAALGKFANAARLNAFIGSAMPYWKPGSLSEEETWEVTAFLLRENGFWDASSELDSSNADQVIIPGGSPTASPVPSVPVGNQGRPLMFIISVAIALLGGVLFLWRVLRRYSSQP